MAEIIAALVKSLRDRTGVGMMDCKRALAETDGDIESAVDLLRKKGLVLKAGERIKLMDDARSDDAHSPDGTVRVEYQVNEVRMSHWIYNPRVIDVETGDVLFDLWGSDYWLWDAMARFDAPRTATLELRSYPGTDPGFRVRIDASTRTFTIVKGTCPPEIQARLERETTFEAVEQAEVTPAVGARVSHEKYGYGRILAVDGEMLEIAFDKSGGRKTIYSFGVRPA